MNIITFSNNPYRLHQPFESAGYQYVLHFTNCKSN